MPKPVLLDDQFRNYYPNPYDMPIVFLDASGNYRSLYNVDGFNVFYQGVVNNLNLFHSNRFAIRVEYSIDGKEHIEVPDFYMKDHVEKELDEARREEVKVGEARLLRLKVTKKVLADFGTDIEKMVDVELEGTALCKRLDELDPIYEIVETEKHVATGGLFSNIRTVTDTVKTFQPRVF